MRKLSHPVTIITTNCHQEFHAATISSLTSISLDPIPLISFSLRLPSKLFNLISLNHHHPFNVHLLNHDHQSITLSKRFSKPRSSLETKIGLDDDQKQLIGDQIGLGRLVCSIWKTIELMEDSSKEKEVKSVLILAKVIKVIDVETLHQSKPLLYYNQTYTTLQD
ncbi:uncharacterized protein MELLADRAFT_108603 [Melampsora larici-populina 98AG31]|uniref:Flavin reductase like domain-containing protein n=1 Tax=Melampsora larici-populina (strain 98AG31 / pathotype 3-4-7) TaxID=747676 RepID=F4RTM5_MELLP|nr:uncharacterized protein MELLADRAFT_108603 [Melampsora larici-populina 98AG31]EGG04282.1 hypothetical protein MELLADRAFT_108603 [Melampsora larici-populina 98AG31]